MNKKAFEPCCNKFKKVAVQFSDLAANDDLRLRMLSELLLRLRNDMPLSAQELHSVAYELEQYLNRKMIRECWFFNSSLRACTFDDADIKAEFQKLARKVRES